MDMNEYQRWTRTTVVTPGVRTVDYLERGLAGEVGEYLSHSAKYVRGDFGIEELEHRLYKELGDILWFVARLADHNGWALEGIALANQDKLNGRKVNETIQGDGDDR